MKKLGPDHLLIRNDLEPPKYNITLGDLSHAIEPAHRTSLNLAMLWKIEVVLCGFAWVIYFGTKSNPKGVIIMH